MKLVNKFAIWYLALTSVVLIAGSVLVFRSVIKENDEEEIRRLTGWIEDAVRKLEENVPVDSIQSDRVIIRSLPADRPRILFSTKDTIGYHSAFQGTERQIQASASFIIDGQHYLVITRSFAPEPEETITGVVRSLSWIFLILLFLVAVTSLLVSRKILYPFNVSLRAIQNFNLKQQQSIRLPKTRTSEFVELNTFLDKMTSKALYDYKALKEFTENASHELQTPLAIIRGKLELLLESKISDEQAKLILGAHEAVERLSKTNQALTLLTKLENQEYQATTHFALSNRIHQIIESLSELLEMKSLELTMDIEQNVKLNLHPALADILVTNLLSNAIRHNIPAGKIVVTLRKAFFEVRNTGPEPEVPTETLFERFRKSNQSGDSIGLGLSIVKRICEVSRFLITYTFANGWHSLKVTFEPQDEK